MDLRPYIEKFGRRLNEVEAALSDPAVFAHKQRAQELSREYARLKELVAAGSAYARTFADLEANRALLKSEPVGSEMAELAREEIARLEIEEGRLALAVRHGVLPPDPTDSRNTIIELRAGAGGSESALFAADLFRMFTRYGESRGWKIETLDSSPSDLGGFKEIVFTVTGTDVYKRLKHDALAFFYLQRSGIPIKMPYAGSKAYERPAGHRPEVAGPEVNGSASGLEVNNGKGGGE